MKSFHLIILFFSLVLGTTTFAQKAKIDSLENELQHHIKKDTIRVNLLNEYAKLTYTNNSEKAYVYLTEAEKITSDIGFEKGKADVIFINGNIKFTQYDYDHAIKYFEKARPIYEKLNLDSKVASCYLNLGLCFYVKGEYTKSIDYFRSSIKINKKINNKEDIARSYKYIGYAHYELSHFENALKYYSKALHLNIRLGYEEEIASCYNNIGSVYSKQTNNPLAIENYYKSLEIREKLKDTVGVAMVLNNIGIVYRSNEKYDLALDYYQRSLKVHRQTGDKRSISIALGNIGDLYRIKDEYKKSLKYHEEALKLSTQTGDNVTASRSLNNLGHTHIQLNNNKLARQYFEKGQKIDLEAEDQLGLCGSYFGIATTYFNDKEYDKALTNALRSESLSNKLKSIDLQRDVYELLAKIYAKKGTFDKAFESHQQFKILNDSIFNKENIEKITQLEYEYKYKQERESANFRELNLTKTVKSTTTDLKKSQRNSLIAIIIILLVLIISAGLIFYMKLRNANAKTQNIIIEQKLLRSQMTPHFIFNSLSILQGMILNKEEKNSISYLSKFSKLLRTILENSRHKTVTLSSELGAIDSYMSLQNFDTSSPYNYAITVDPKLDTSQFMVPPMLIQPFVENAIEHAFGGQKENKEIKIGLSYQDEKLVCVIADNGIGVNTKNIQIKENKNSLATTITAERLQLLSKDFKVNGSLTITNRKELGEQGTLVTLVMPYKIEPTL